MFLGALLLAFTPGFDVLGHYSALAASLLGRLLKSDVDASHEGSELLKVSEANPYAGPVGD